jgi:hypothetical protein
MAYIQPDQPFLPRPRGPFSESGDGGTDPNGVPWCPVDVPCGWECPRCHRVWNLSVLACHNCPEPPAFIAKAETDPLAMSLRLPAEMTRPGSYRSARITGEWNEIMPGLQCRYGGTGDCAVVGRAAPDVSAFINLRITPAGNDPGPIETGR